MEVYACIYTYMEVYGGIQRYRGDRDEGAAAGELKPFKLCQPGRYDN